MYESHFGLSAPPFQLSPEERARLDQLAREDHAGNPLPCIEAKDGRRSYRIPTAEKR